ncbi:MAG: protein kinase [Kofleriaceae bacterium]
MLTFPIAPWWSCRRRRTTRAAAWKGSSSTSDAVEGEIGRGAMGIVYRARHVAIDRPVAIKVLHRELLHTHNMVERFEREALLAAKLHHPNVVPVIDVGQLADGRRMMVLERPPDPLSLDLDPPGAGDATRARAGDGAARRDRARPRALVVTAWARSRTPASAGCHRATASR